MTAQQGMVTADLGKQWMLASSALALGNTFALLPFRLVDPGATAHAQLFSAGGMTDAIVSSIGFIVLIITPFPLWRRLGGVPEGRRLKPAMSAADTGHLVLSTLHTTTAAQSITRILDFFKAD